MRPSTTLNWARPFVCLGGVLALAATPVRHSQSVFGDIVEGTIIVGLAGQAPQVLDRTAIARLPHNTVKVRDAQGKAVVYAGVLLYDLLASTGVRFSGADSLGSYLMVEAVEDHHVLFALAELDPMLTEKRVILADAKDGKSLNPPEGPFRIIVPDEKRSTRWSKHVWAIYVVPES